MSSLADLGSNSQWCPYNSICRFVSAIRVMGNKISSVILVAFFILSSYNCRSLNATDTMLVHESVVDGQTLVSANKTFELGFFSPVNSSNRYVGIWYHRITPQTVVWVANRDAPIMDTSAVLHFDINGNLIITDSRRSSTIVAAISSTRDISATILDSGNLVLRETQNSSLVLWQSFDHPTDTFLPGMKLGIVGGSNRLVTSWTSSAAPASGEFSIGANPNGTKQLFIWHRSNVYWDSGMWNGTEFTVLKGDNNVPLTYSYTSTGNDTYMTYSLKDDSTIVFAMLSVTGSLQLVSWFESMQLWVLLLSVPTIRCDVFNLCGDFGMCNENMSPSCSCLKGFEPSSAKDWSNGATQGGCMRSSRLNCNSGGEQDKFLLFPTMKLPAYPHSWDASDQSGCEASCLKNCSCSAYAYTDGCQLWFGNLEDTRRMFNYTKEHIISNYPVGDLYLRLAASEFGGTKRLPLVIYVVLPIVVAILSISFIWYWSWRRQRQMAREEGLQEQNFLSWGAAIASKFGENGKSGEDFTLFRFSQLSAATDNFLAANKLGEGGFGPVYKGQFQNGQEIAVKRLSACSGQGLNEFKNEILLIAKLQHRNLVRLLGCCIKAEEKLLVYEYMPNKSLDLFLFDPKRGAELDWDRRFHIVEGIAEGLLYLHKHSRLTIIHRDLKASNILLDGEMNPKISDFGMARIFGANETEANTNRVVGTYGYISPEYAAEGLFSFKSDVFSFGVLLLEIVTGKRNAGFHRYGNSLNLLGHAWEMWKENKYLDLKDSRLGDTCPANKLRRCIHVALLCVQESAIDRPNIVEVIAMLSSESADLPDPKQPAFFALQVQDEVESTSTPTMSLSCSVNNETMSVVDAR